MTAGAETLLVGESLQAKRFPDGSVALTIDGHALHLNPKQAQTLRIFSEVCIDRAGGPTLLQEAREIIYGDREQTHGEPQKNLRAIADIWTALIGTRISPEQVCLMMIGLKLARAANQPRHREHWLDTIGYAALAERCGFVAPKQENS